MSNRVEMFAEGLIYQDGLCRVCWSSMFRVYACGLSGSL